MSGCSGSIYARQLELLPTFPALAALGDDRQQGRYDTLTHLPNKCQPITCGHCRLSFGTIRNAYGNRDCTQDALMSAPLSDVITVILVLPDANSAFRNAQRDRVLFLDESGFALSIWGRVHEQRVKLKPDGRNSRLAKLRISPALGSHARLVNLHLNS